MQALLWKVCLVIAKVRTQPAKPISWTVPFPDEETGLVDKGNVVHNGVLKGSVYHILF